MAMGHLVRYRTAAGEDASEEVAALDDALDLAARLRNDDRAEDVRVYAEVPLRFETFVKVSVADVEADLDAPEREDEPSPDAEAPAESPEANTAVEPPPGAMPLTPVRVAAGDAPGSMFQGN